MPPGRPEMTGVAGRSVTLCWTEPDDDGGCKIGNYIVEYYRVRWDGAVVLRFGSVPMEMVSCHKLVFAFAGWCWGYNSSV
jgi:hypothetical protein